MSTRKKAAPKKAPAKKARPAKPEKNHGRKAPKPADIASAVEIVVAKTRKALIGDVNRELWSKGFERITAKRRDQVIKAKGIVVPKRSGKYPPGGARKGSGRKKGAATTKTREIADKLIQDGEITPLEYMLRELRTTDDDLRRMHKNGEIDTAEFVIRLKMNIDRRDNFAEKAAPYIHPRLSSVTAKVTGSEHDEWIAMMEELDA